MLNFAFAAIRLHFCMSIKNKYLKINEDKKENRSEQLPTHTCEMRLELPLTMPAARFFNDDCVPFIDNCSDFF